VQNRRATRTGLSIVESAKYMKKSGCALFRGSPGQIRSTNLNPCSDRTEIGYDMMGLSTGPTLISFRLHDDHWRVLGLISRAGTLYYQKRKPMGDNMDECNHTIPFMQLLTPEFRQSYEKGDIQALRSATEPPKFTSCWLSKANTNPCSPVSHKSNNKSHLI